LGAPVGSVLVGSEELIGKARRLRKMAGGGMRQAGILAAAGIYALEKNVKRLVKDHENAKILAEGLADIDGMAVDMSAMQTNMVFITMDSARQERLVDFLKGQGVLAGGYGQLRMVTHHDVDTDGIAVAIDAVKKFNFLDKRR
jgi:threonine aldolase